MNGLKEIWSALKGFLFAFLVIIVSMGAINCSYAFSLLHEIDPAYETQGIYWVAGVVNLLVCGYLLWKRYAKDNGKEEK